MLAADGQRESGACRDERITSAEKGEYRRKSRNEITAAVTTERWEPLSSVDGLFACNNPLGGRGTAAAAVFWRDLPPPGARSPLSSVSSRFMEKKPSRSPKAFDTGRCRRRSYYLIVWRKIILVNGSAAGGWVVGRRCRRPLSVRTVDDIFSPAASCGRDEV